MSVAKELVEQLAEQAIARLPFVRFAFWPNQNMRDGRRDPNYSGRCQISTVKCAELLAAALADGKQDVELWADLWLNTDTDETNRPILSGRARTIVEPKVEATA